MVLDLLRVDHTGGFRKPDRLRDAYVRFARGETDEGEVRALQDDAVRALIRQEEAHNLPVLSDGEYRSTVYPYRAVSSGCATCRWTSTASPRRSPIVPSK
jgi:hypothetical protein